MELPRTRLFTNKALSALLIPLFMEQLLGTLRRAGLVTTVRGAQGGYLLAKAPEEITVGNIIDALEGVVRETITVPADGLVFSQRSYSAVYPGTLIARLYIPGKDGAKA